MEIKEIRIGSFYLVDDEVCLMDYHTLYDLFQTDEERCEPIPLTEDWLHKFDFYINTNNFNETYGGLDIPSDYHAQITYSDGKLYMIDCDGGKIGADILYVHQIQNIWFALTGEELTISK